MLSTKSEICDCTQICIIDNKLKSRHNYKLTCAYVTVSKLASMQGDKHDMTLMFVARLQASPAALGLVAISLFDLGYSLLMHFYTVLLYNNCTRLSDDQLATKVLPTTLPW
jgi:hypothetical protein